MSSTSGIALIFSAAYYFVVRKFDIPLQIGLAFIVIGIALFAVLDPEKVRTFFTGRQIKYGSNFVIFSIAVLGILVVPIFSSISIPSNGILQKIRIIL